MERVRLEEYAPPLQQFVRLLMEQKASVEALHVLNRTYKIPLLSGDYEKLSPRLAQHLLSLFGKQIDAMCMLTSNQEPIIRLWGERMGQIYDSLPASTKSAFTQSRHQLAFITQANAFMRNPAHARDGLMALGDASKALGTYELYLDVLDSYLLGTARHENLLYAFDDLGETLLRDLPLPRKRSLFKQFVASSRLVPPVSFLKKWPNRGKASLIIDFCLDSTLENNALENACHVVDEWKRWKKNGPLPADKVLEVVNRLAASGQTSRARTLLLTATTSETSGPYQLSNIHTLFQAGDFMKAMEVITNLKKAGNFRASNAVGLLFPERLQPISMKRDFERIFPKDDNGKRSPMPNLILYSNCLQAAVNSQAGKVMDWWLQDAESQGLKLNLPFLDSVVKLATTADNEYALKWASERIRSEFGLDPEHASYIVKIDKCGVDGDCKAADDVLVEAVEKGIVPCYKMYKALEAAHIRSGSEIEAKRLSLHCHFMEVVAQRRIERERKEKLQDE